MAELMEYKCPSCSGKLEFDSATQKMKCPFCESVFDMDTVLAYDQELQNAKPDEMKWEESAGNEWQTGETDGMRVYVCNTCGGEVIADQTTSATHCPYCGNPVIMKGNFSGDLKPDYVIPFKLDKNAAKAALANHFKGKRLLPKVFKDNQHIDEIKGVYVPVWLFDANANADIKFKGTKLRHWSDSSYDYTETNYYSISRGGNLNFTNVPVDGSTKMPDDLMESIEPFDMREAVPFQTGYLSGFLADKYDVNAEQSIERANQRIKTSTENVFRNTVTGYNSVTVEESNIALSNSVHKYAMYPVWLLTTSWNGKLYTFAMNGQTGKFVGDLPLDKGAYWRWFGGLTGIIGAGVFLATLLFYFFFM